MSDLDRRAFLRRTAALGAFGFAWPSGRAGAAPTRFPVHAWVRDARNPILPPGSNGFDATRCMNPFALRRGDEYWLFYAGGDAQGRHRICLATAPVDDLTAWKRHGPLFDPGGPGAFDETWCVLPCVHRVGDRWHLYYTGRSAEKDTGLQAFNGIGLAVSDDLRHWKKHGEEPVLKGDGFADWPKNRGVAGGGSIVDVAGEGGRPRYRMHYTLATGRPSGNSRRIRRSNRSSPIPTTASGGRTGA